MCCIEPASWEHWQPTLTPVRGMWTVPLPGTPLLQSVAVPAELSPVFDEVASPQPTVVRVSASPESPESPLRPPLAAPPAPLSVRALPFTPAPEPVRLRRRRVPLWPLPPDEAEACEVNVCFSREVHGRKERRERPPHLRDKGVEVEVRKRKRAREREER